MNKQQTILILLLLLPLLFVLYFLGPFLLMPFIDSSWYYSEEVDIGPFDYNSVLTKAEKAGYEVEGSWPWPGNFSGFEPGDVTEVRENFGNAALAQDIRLNYNENSELMVFTCKDGWKKAPEPVLLSRTSATPTLSLLYSYQNFLMIHGYLKNWDSSSARMKKLRKSISML